MLRRAYGCNTLNGQQDPVVCVDKDNDDGNDEGNAFFKCAAGVVATVLRAFCNQLREPLILMLLFLVGVPLCLGNVANAVSTGMALAIVSMVAAIQEYRSKRGEWCMR